MANTTTAALAGVAVLALIAVQFVPWASYEENSNVLGFPFDVKITSYTWQNKADLNGDETSTSWYDDDADGDGVNLVRTAIPTLIVGMVVTLLGAVLSGTGRGNLGPVLALIGGGIVGVAVLLFSLGLDEVYDGNQAWGVAFYVAIGAAALALAGGIVGLLSGPARSTA